MAHVVLEAAYPGDTVVAEVELLEVDELVEPFDDGDAVALCGDLSSRSEEFATNLTHLHAEEAQVHEGVESFELGDLVLAKPELRQVGQALERLYPLLLIQHVD